MISKEITQAYDNYRGDCEDVSLYDFEAGYKAGAQAKWISVTDRLPGKGVLVLAHQSRNNITITAYYEPGEYYPWKTGGYPLSWFDGVTHWMPLPEPPLDGKN